MRRKTWIALDFLRPLLWKIFFTSEAYICIMYFLRDYIYIKERAARNVLRCTEIDPNFQNFLGGRTPQTGHTRTLQAASRSVINHQQLVFAPNCECSSYRFGSHYPRHCSMRGHERHTITVSLGKRYVVPELTAWKRCKFDVIWTR